MNLDQAKAQMAAATESAKSQIELNQQSLSNHLDAADRIVMRQAAEATIAIAKAPTSDPT